MKIICLTCGFYFIWNFGHVLCQRNRGRIDTLTNDTTYVNSPNFKEDLLKYENISFDWINRGGFKLSNCSKDLLNCWELMPTEIFCQEQNLYGSVCDPVSSYCFDKSGDYDAYNHVFKISEMKCYSNLIYTRRNAIFNSIAAIEDTYYFVDMRCDSCAKENVFENESSSNTNDNFLKTTSASSTMSVEMHRRSGEAAKSQIEH